MSFESFIALRYLTASRGRAHVALVATISIIGLAVGVAALIISLALLSGFQDRIRAQMAERSPHLIVSPRRGDRLEDPVSVARALSLLPGVASVAPVIEGRGWLAAVRGRGATPVRYRNAPEGLLPPVSADQVPPTRVLGSTLARLAAERGSLLRLASSRTRLSPIGPIPVAVELRVEAVRRASLLEKAVEVEVPEEIARRLSGTPSGARSYEARLADPTAAEAVAARLRGQLGPNRLVRTWRDLNAPLAFALRLEKLVIFATVALVILVAALNIVSHIALLVIEKKRDLGVLTAMGATPRSLLRIYLVIGGVVGFVGTAIGCAIGVTVSVVLDRYGLVPLPGDVYLLSHVPFAVHVREVLLVAGFAVATALAAAILPARAAARIAPGEAIRLSR